MSAKLERSEYMRWVTDNANTFVRGEKNLVACVFCVEIYETCTFRTICGCLACYTCGVDALMVVKHSPLLEMTDEERMKKLKEWHKQGFSALGRFSDSNEQLADQDEEEIIVFKGFDYIDKKEKQNKASEQLSK